MIQPDGSDMRDVQCQVNFFYWFHETGGAISDFYDFRRKIFPDHDDVWLSWILTSDADSHSSFTPSIGIIQIPLFCELSGWAKLFCTWAPKVKQLVILRLVFDFRVIPALSKNEDCIMIVRSWRVLTKSWKLTNNIWNDHRPTIFAKSLRSERIFAVLNCGVGFWPKFGS